MSRQIKISCPHKLLVYNVRIVTALKLLKANTKYSTSRMYGNSIPESSQIQIKKKLKKKKKTTTMTTPSPITWACFPTVNHSLVILSSNTPDFFPMRREEE